VGSFGGGALDVGGERALGRKREDWCGGGGRRVASEKDWHEMVTVCRGEEKIFEKNLHNS